MRPLDQVLYYLSGSDSRLSSYDLAALVRRHDSYIRRLITQLRFSGMIDATGTLTRHGEAYLGKILGAC